ncbi:MAG: TldD/PmbA family protein [Alphaproteobacteria bacterium]|nr:TldD/PmbA family protein [Alphaproteobacteria bacterium]
MTRDVHLAVTEHFARYGVDEALIGPALAAATAHGADHAELFFQHSESTSIGLSDRIVNRVHTSVDLGVGVRVVVGDQVGYAYTEDLTLEHVLRAARTAAEIARGSGASAPVRVAGAVEVPDFYPLSRSWGDVELSERIPLVRAWEQAAFDADARVRKVQIHLSDGESRVLVARADGRRVADLRPMTSAWVSVNVEDGGRAEHGSYNVAGRTGLELYDPGRQQRLVDLAVDRAVKALDAGSAPAGELPVVMAAGSSGILLHEAIGHGMEADFNRKGTSIFADKMGRSVAHDTVTVVDDATLPGSRGALNVDDEGNATERTVLVDHGTMASYLHDEISARHYGVAPTGSGRRQSFRHPVLPRMRATYMEAGPHDPADIIASVKHGVYCETFANGQVQIGGGDFAFYVRFGYLIEDGRLTRPIKDVNLVGNGPKVLAAIDMVGNDLVIDEGGWTCGKDGQGVPVSQGMPTVRVSKLSVGGGR